MRLFEAIAQAFANISTQARHFARFSPSIDVGAAVLLAVFSSSAIAQEQIINYGQLAVTGYSGSTAVAPPQGEDPFDYLRIKLDGPSARVVEVRVLGPQGQLSNATKPFTVTASQVGQVFGVTLDNAPRPNIYVAATSAYGLAIAIVDQNGQQKRVRKGQPGAQWMAGQFGPPALGGGPGSIWKIDGTTGAVSLFANVQNAALGAASLGGLAFDPRTNQIFAVDRGTGIIHRFGLDGIQRGTYDHGIEGRGPAGLPPMPPPPVTPINIGSPAFDTENPTSWGFAAPARRPFALAVHDDRLYYSIKQGPQVWSVGISASGAVAAGPRVEVEVPSLQEGVEITSIVFDGQGRMYLAERGSTTGDYFRYNLANGGASRVLRYVRKLPGDPTPGLWRLTPEQYSIGLPPNYANAEGGVALGFAYNPDNVIDFNTCGVTLWSTGERLLDPGDPTAPPDSFPNIDGLQANAINLVQPQNTPPKQSWFIDYDDLNGDANYRGHMGAVATLPCPGAPQVLPPPPAPPPPPISCPPGTYFADGQCLIIPTCPPGTYYADGKCYYNECPPGYVFANGQCKPPPVVCPPGTFYYQGQCFPISCPPGLIKAPNGQCKCPPGNIFYNGQCIPPQNCPPGLIELPGGMCWCPLGTIFNDGFCQPNTCPAGQVWKNGFCQNCPPGQIVENGQCKSCPPGKKKQGNKCVPICPPDKTFWKGTCVPKCSPGEIHKEPDGACGPPDEGQPCPPDKVMWKGSCVPKCPLNLIHKEPDGACGPPDIVQPCAANQEMWNGSCVPKCPLNLIHKEPDGACGPPDIVQPCAANQEMWQGACVPKCPPDQIHKGPDGACGPLGEVGIPPIQCLAPNTKWGDKCLPPCPPNQTHQPPDGACKQMQLCFGTNKEVWQGLCVDKCPKGQNHVGPDGHCVAVPKLPDFPLIPQPSPLPAPPTPLPGDLKPVPPPEGPQPPPPSSGGPVIKLPGVQLPGVKLPGIVTPPPAETPPAQPQPKEPPPTQPPPAPPATGPTLKVPGLNLPAIQIPGIAQPPTEPPPPQRTSPPPSTSTPPPSSANPPAKVAPNINLPNLLKGLQQMKQTPKGNTGENGSKARNSTETTPPPTAPQAIPQLQLQQQIMTAPAAR